MSFKVNMCYAKNNGFVDIGNSDDKTYCDPSTKVYFKTTAKRHEFLKNAKWEEIKKFPDGELNVGSSLFSFSCEQDVMLISDDGIHVAVCYHFGKAMYLAGIMVPNHEYTKDVIGAFAKHAEKLKGTNDVASQS